MERGTETRSGLLWQVERILKELKEDGTLIPVLIMENVPQVITAKGWREWCGFLQELGYSNYCEILNATDYGLPQNRKRAFMVSILGDYNYRFGTKMELRTFLLDLIEKYVDDSYFLTEKQIDDISHWKAQQKPLETMEKIAETGIAPTLTTRSGEYTSGMILIKNATKKGYLEAHEGDGIDVGGRMQYHRGTVQKGIAQTLTTVPSLGVVVKQEKELGIRKTTSRENFKLMGVKEEDYSNAAKNQTFASLNHLAGDSICTTVLMMIFGQMLGIDYKQKINELLEELKEKS